MGAWLLSGFGALVIFADSFVFFGFFGEGCGLDVGERSMVWCCGSCFAGVACSSYTTDRRSLLTAKLRCSDSNLRDRETERDRERQKDRAIERDRDTER